MPHSALARAEAFCQAIGIRIPILMAPMAGACPAALAIAVAQAGGMGGCGTLMMSREAIQDWVRAFRSGTNGAFQLNSWTPDPDPVRDPEHEAELRAFLANWGPEVPEDAGDAGLPDFAQHCAALIEAGPPVISSIMGLYPPDMVRQMKDRGIKWFATVTTVGEALEAEAAGADVVIAQGMEAGGHRGAFKAEDAASALVGLFALVPAVADAVKVPVVATGGIADARGVAAALLLGASAVQIGTGLLRTPEAGIAPAWAAAIGRTQPEGTIATRAFSGRLGRSVRTAYAAAASGPDAPDPAPYPVQRGLTGPMRAQAAKQDNLDGMQAWAGQSARLAQDRPASEVVTELWVGAKALLAI